MSIGKTPLGPFFQELLSQSFESPPTYSLPGYPSTYKFVGNGVLLPPTPKYSVVSLALKRSTGPSSTISVASDVAGNKENLASLLEAITVDNNVPLSQSTVCSLNLFSPGQDSSYGDATALSQTLSQSCQQQMGVAATALCTQNSQTQGMPLCSQNSQTQIGSLCSQKLSQSQSSKVYKLNPVSVKSISKPHTGRVDHRQNRIPKSEPKPKRAGKMQISMAEFMTLRQFDIDRQIWIWLKEKFIRPGVNVFSYVDIFKRKHSASLLPNGSYQADVLDGVVFKTLLRWLKHVLEVPLNATPTFVFNELRRVAYKSQSLPRLMLEYQSSGKPLVCLGGATLGQKSISRHQRKSIWEPTCGSPGLFE